MQQGWDSSSNPRQPTRIAYDIALLSRAVSNHMLYRLNIDLESVGEAFKMWNGLTRQDYMISY